MRRARAAFAAACAIAVLAGCGGKDEPRQSGLERWTAAAEAICDRAEKAIRAEPRPRDWEDLERVLVRAGDHAIGAVEEIRALPVPEDARRALRPILKDLEEAGNDVERFRAAVAQYDPKGLEVRVADFRIVARQRAGRAEEAGLERCGREAQAMAVADELLTPAFADSVAVVMIELAQDVEPLIGTARASAGRERVRAWQEVADRADELHGHIGSVPDRLERHDDGFGFRLYNLVGIANELQVYVVDGRERKARRMEASAARVLARVQEGGMTILREAGPAGRALIPLVRRELRAAR